MPVDADPSPDGNVILERAGAAVLAFVFSTSAAATAARPGERHHRSHFVTCPDSASFRRGRSPGRAAYRFSFDYWQPTGNTLRPLPEAIAETIDRALRKDFGGYTRGSLTWEVVPSPPELARMRRVEMAALREQLTDPEAFWFDQRQPQED